jgi:spermidine/putrescine transport system substrate-binding protein
MLPFLEPALLQLGEMPLAIKQRQADLNILCWEGYGDRSFLAPFEAEHGITAFGESFLSDFEAATRLAGDERQLWDLININNPFVQDFLFPRGVIRPLDRRRFDPLLAKMLPQFEPLRRCAFSRDGGQLLGVCQRFGTFNLVVDTKRISAVTAEDQGFHLAIDARGLETFFATAKQWFAAARLVTGDHQALNQALVAGEIDFYVSGGVYTCSPLRLAGHRNIRGITPARGPIGGKGGIAFAEVTSVVERADTPPAAEEYLAYMLRAEAAIAIAFASGACNPVMQMGDPAVMRAFTADQLDAMQWPSLEEDIARCAPYALAPQYETLLARLREASQSAGRPRAACDNQSRGTR